MRADGIPFGITLIGPAGSDLMLAELGAALSRGHRIAARRDSDCALPSMEPLVPRADVAQVAVVGAHCRGPAAQSRAHRTRRAARAPHAHSGGAIDCIALPGTTPPKPGMVRAAGDAGHAIDVEVWELPIAGIRLASSPAFRAPLSIGTIELDDGTQRAGLPVRSGGARRAPRTFRITAAGATSSGARDRHEPSPRTPPERT